MDSINYGKYFYYVISVLLLITGLFGIKRLMTKADLPFSYSFQDDKIVSTQKYDIINSGDVIFSIDGVRLESLYQLETLTDARSIGQNTDLEISSPGKSIFTLHVHLDRYYRSLNFILISLLTGLSFWITSVFLIMKKYGKSSVTVLFWVLMLFSVATITSPGSYFPGYDMIAILIRASHVSSYFLGGVAFLHFTFTFRKDKTAQTKLLIKVMYVISILFCIVLIIVQVFSIIFNSSGWVFAMEKLWKITEALLLVFIIAGSLNLFLNYKSISNRPERKKIEWVFWGLAVGASPFLLLYIVPQVFGVKEVVREEILLSFLILVPVFFAMAVIKYHVFEIDIFIKRSILYSSLTFITIIIYFTAISVITFFANDLLKEYRNLVSISLIILIAFIFNPLQNKIRHFIDRIFYREKYNFEKSVSNFISGIKDRNTVTSLSRYVIDEIEKIIPVKKISLIASNVTGDRLKILSQNNFDDLTEYISAARISKIRFDPEKIITAAEKIEPGIETDNSLNNVLNRWGINVVIPFKLESENNSGALLLGDKQSELRYTKHDIDLLNVLIQNTTLALKKLQMQERLVYEEMEVTRLEELNDMMSYYVSSVSHDLKTPLTSIKMFTEILKEQNNFKNVKEKEYLDIIEGESDRLSRLINNVLNFAKIENGIKEYSFCRTDLNVCIEAALKIMEYQFDIENFKIEKSLQKDIYIIADKDSVTEALLNLFTNTIKYCTDKKVIRVTLNTENEFAVVIIEDEGIGISEDDLENIFRPFVRSKDSNAMHTGGAGIGLSIVKNIMDAHKGRIEAESVLGKGSTFKLFFKLYSDE
ncbi:MAG: ATP-binding protein [Bacteroidetes bacterium]|nr:ATP-binding protein [Bacteroidota bacterium]